MNATNPPNRNSSKPAIRTMENDLRFLKSTDSSPKDIIKNLPQSPMNLPIEPASLKLKRSEPSFPSRPVEPKTVEKSEALSQKGAGQRAQRDREISQTKPPEKEAGIGKALKPAGKGKTGLGKIQALEKASLSTPEKSAQPPKPLFFKPKTPPPQSAIKERVMPVTPKSEALLGAKEEENLPPEARLAAQSGLSPFSPNFDLQKAAQTNKPRPNDATSQLDRYEIISSGEKTGYGLGRILKYAAIVAVLAIASYGVYYLALLKKISPATEQSSELLIAGASELDFQSDLNTELSGEIKKYFFAPGEQNGSGPKSAGAYRLVIKNRDGTKVLKTDDLKKYLKLDFPPDVMGALDKDYNLLAFNYPQKNYLRLGLAFKIRDAGALLEELAKWEPSMFANLEPLFLDSIAPSAAGFQSNAYNSVNIRYLPLGSADAALNYAIDKNNKFLLIATSKEDMYYLIDKISQ